jgi:sugar phosphate isomerase/epimerase
LKIGLVTDSLRLPFDEAVSFAAALGVDGIQPYVVSGGLAAWDLAPVRRRELRARVVEAGLEFSALCGDLGGGFTQANDTPLRWERMKAVFGLAAEWGAPVVSGHIGVIPTACNTERNRLVEVLRRVGTLARAAGVRYAVETGPEPAGVLRGFIEEVSDPGVQVNFDPANLVMVQGESAAEAVAELAPHIVHFHAKDGRRLRPLDPVRLYQGFADLDAAFLQSLDSYFVETPLGEGDVRFPRVLSALQRIGYRGYLTVEREAGDRRQADVRQAVASLRTWLAAPVSEPR